jgi:hypothetical protein
MRIKADSLVTAVRGEIYRGNLHDERETAEALRDNPRRPTR